MTLNNAAQQAAGKGKAHARKPAGSPQGRRTNATADMNKHDILLFSLLISLNKKADKLISLLEVSQHTEDSGDDGADASNNSPDGFQDCFEKNVAANPNMTAIMQDIDHNVYVVGVKEAANTPVINVYGGPSTRQERGILVATINEILLEQSAGKSSQQ